MSDVEGGVEGVAAMWFLSEVQNRCGFGNQPLSDEGIDTKHSM